MGKAQRWEAFLSNPTAIIITLLVLALLGALWYYTEVQESKEADAERARDRGQGDSIWKN